MAKKKKSKKNWIGKATKKMEKKGTKGSFTKWCKNHGFRSVNKACIKAAMKQGGKVAKKAQFARAVGAGKK